MKREKLMCACAEERRKIRERLGEKRKAKAKPFQHKAAET